MKQKSQDSQRLSKPQSDLLEKELDTIKEGRLIGGESKVLRLFEYALQARSKNQVLMIHEALKNAQMLQDLRDLHRTVVLRLIAIQLSKFQEIEGRFPEFREDTGNEEFLLSVFLHLKLHGGDIFERESSWEKE